MKKGNHSTRPLDASSSHDERRGSLAPASTKLQNRPLLLVLNGRQQGAIIPLHGSSTRLGRSRDVEVSLDDNAVSTLHAQLVRRSDGFYLDDTNSRNGTFVNDERVAEPRRLGDGDHIRLGNVILRFSLVDELEERALTGLFEQTVRDPLTRAHNRRYLMQHLQSELAFASRQGSSLALLLIDIDHFKQVNDNYGHAVGDVVLQLVASTIQRLLRPYDALCRYGGEEFVVVARNTSLRNAEILAQRIRHQIEALRFEVDGHWGSITVSIGVTSTWPEQRAGDAEELLVAVDRALYAAKDAGRNRVCSGSPPSSASQLPRRTLHTAPPLPPEPPTARANDWVRPAGVPRFN